MTGTYVYYYDIAALAVTSVTLLSIVLRRVIRGPANRVFFSAVILVLLTTLAGLGCELYDEFLGPFLAEHRLMDPAYPHVARSAMQLVYFLLRSLNAPAYLVLISAFSGTSHRLNKNLATQLALWVPMVAVDLIILTNPVHHLIYSIQDDVMQRGPFIWVIYASALYYTLVGIWWLVRWKPVMDEDEFSTLMLMYPLVLLSVVIQYFYMNLRVEMFFTSVGLMLVSAFVIRPEKQLDSLVSASSLQAYREACSRAFITQKPLCLVYLELVNIEKLRELVGKEELQGIVVGVSADLSRRLQRGDVMYYLRNGLFCIQPNNIDADRAYGITLQMHEEGKARALAENNRGAIVRLRSCVVRVPEDVSSYEELRTFVRRFEHLVPDSDVTTFAALSRQDDFALNMALPSIVERAIRERSFEVYYQPIYCVADGRFHSAEALVRLHDPDFGWISPALFIPEAEQSGAIIEIGSILQEQICAFLGGAGKQARGLDYVEVNLSVDQCIRPQMAGELLELMHRHGVEPSRVNLEITETSSAFSQQIIDRNVRILSAEGVTFSLDDYGTGYSNVTRILDLPVSIVKFDKSFVDDMDSEATRVVLERSIDMMHQIGKKVLVEGIETKAQSDALCAMGVDYIQGYHYARPMPPDEFLAFLER